MFNHWWTHPLHSLGNSCEVPGYFGDQVNSLIINNGKINMFLWWSQASKRPICSRVKLQATESKNVLWATTSRTCIVNSLHEPKIAKRGVTLSRYF